MQLDIAIIGGGINGLAIAHALAGRYGADVALFDDQKLGAASRAAAGFLGAQTEGAHLPEAARPGVFLTLRQSRLLHEFLDVHLRELVGAGSGYRCAGALHVARDERELDELARRYLWQLGYGAAVSVLTGREARSLEPSLSPSIAGAVYLPDEAVIDPPGLLASLRLACGELGVRTIGERVRRVTCEGGRVAGLRTDGGAYAVDAVVVAAGGWLEGIEGMPPLLSRVRPKSGRTVMLRGPDRAPGHVVLSAQSYLVPWADGSLALGSTLEGADADDDMLAGLYGAIAAVPSLASCQVRHTRVGYRPHAPDGLPWVGRAGPDGLFIATGNVRNGMLLAPATAALVGEMVSGHLRDDGPLAPPRAWRGAAAAHAS